MRHEDYRSCVTVTTDRSSHGRRASELAGDVPADLDLVDGRGHPRDALAGLALEPGDVEIALHVTAFLDDLVRDDHEVVGVEVAADVRVRQEPRVGRVARALEAVELEATHRVDVAQLVGEQDP